MVHSINKGFFGKYESEEFLKKIQQNGFTQDTLETKLNNLSPEDKEFIKLAFKAAESSKGKCSAWTHRTDSRHTGNATASTGNIYQRFRL